MIDYGIITMLLLAIFFGLLSNKVWAGPGLPYGPQPSELILLPDFCQAKLGKNEMLQKKWSKQMGQKSFVHLHHYCFGVNFINRANSEFSDNRLKGNYYKLAIANFNYVLQRWKPSFYLYKRAELYKQQAELLKSMVNNMQ